MQPLVSILIPAYNAGKWIHETITSAVKQSYENKEVIVVDDGSRDDTLQIARRFEAPRVKVVHQPNAGGAAARNAALALAQGDYVQWLDHDDLLAVDKVSEQMQRVRALGDARHLFTGAFGTFYYCSERARMRTGPMWRDLKPLDYFFVKFEQNEWLHTTCWLVSRQLTEGAGPWLDLRTPDDDGEYFCRVVAASSGINFVPTAKTYWRIGNTSSFSHSRRTSPAALSALLESTRQCIEHFRKLEDSERSRRACVTFLRNRLIYYYPQQPEMLAQIYALAESLGGNLAQVKPPLYPHYEMLARVFGWRLGRRAQDVIPAAKQGALRCWDKLIYDFVNHGSGRA